MYANETVIIPYRFSDDLKDIPQETKFIIFGQKNANYRTWFNLKIDNLPQNLITLNFKNGCFDQRIDKLPKNLTKLVLGRHFNRKINNLPKNLIRLTFGEKFNEEIDKIPKNVQYLKLGWNFQNNIILPKTVENFIITCNNNFINNIPKHIEKIHVEFDDYNENLNKKVNNLPITIKEIVIKYEHYKEYIKKPVGCVITIKNT
jgi:hypothetical protein